MQTIINIIVFLLILGSIIIIHELGHFLAAKFFGVYCGQFSIGFGPKLWSKKGKETEYEIRALPFGGFVAMAGEEDQADNEDMQDFPVERTLKGKMCIRDRYYSEIATLKPAKKVKLHHHLSYRRGYHNYYLLDQGIKDEKEMVFIFLKNVKK